MQQEHGPGASPRALRRSWFALPLLLLPLLVGSVADADEHKASVLGLEAAPCLLRSVAGEHVCPGCGLSRGTALAVHGEIGRSWSVHPAGVLVAVLCALGALIHLHILLARRRAWLHDRLLRQGYRIFVVGILAAWLVRLTG
ncbi:MAG: DUF2752 domain-containing protein [Planctomycetota bacterium]|jgi:hypothetical protein